MAQDIVVRYRAEVDDLLRKLDQISDAQKEVIQGETKANDEAKKAATTQQFAATKRNQLLELEKKKLAELQKAQKLAFDPKQIDAYNKKIQESNRNIELLTDNTKKQTSVAGGALKSFALGAGAAIAAAFSVDAIIQFGKASIDGFLAAEKASERLRFSIVTLGNNSEAAFERLEKQAEKLEQTLAIDADNIKEAQGALAAFGLTADQIEEAIPKLADFATVTGVDIVQAAQQVGAGLEGAGREFKKYGIEVSATASRQDNLNNILKGFGTFAGAAENATKTLSGTLEQTRLRSEALKDEIGAKLAPAFVRAKVAVLDFFASLLGADNINELQSELRGVVKNVDEVSAALDDAGVKVNTLNDFWQSLIVTISGGAKLGAAGIEGQRQELAKLVDLIISQSNESRKLVKTQEDLNVQGIKLLGIQSQIDNAFKTGKINAEAQAIATGILNENLKKLGSSYQDYIKQQQRASADAAAEAKRLADAEAAALAEAQRKANEERLKEIERLRKEIEDDAKGLTAFEKSELNKRDTAYLDSLEKRRKGLQELADAEKDRAAQAEQIRFDQQIEELQGEELEVRQKFADEFKKLTLEDLEVKKNAIRAEVGFTEDANNQITILEKETNDRLKKLYEDLGLSWKGVTSDKVSDWIKANGEILNATAALFNEIANLTSALGDRRIDEINRQKDAEIEAIDQALEANEIALEKRRISEKQAADNEKKLLDEKVKAEETAAKKEREIKRRQAILDKAAALVTIAIQTAINVAKYVPPNPLIALAIALGAAQAAIVAAQPIPYAKGTKNAKEGLARVGEQGEEIMYVPKGTKVLPNRQTNRYGEVLDAMFDNRFDEYVNRRYIAPALMKEKARRESNQQRSFAENIVQSAMINPQTGLTYTDLEQIRKKGTKLTDDTIERLADALTRRTINDPYRR